MQHTLSFICWTLSASEAFLGLADCGWFGTRCPPETPLEKLLRTHACVDFIPANSYSQDGDERISQLLNGSLLDHFLTNQNLLSNDVEELPSLNNWPIAISDARAEKRFDFSWRFCFLALRFFMVITPLSFQLKYRLNGNVATLQHFRLEVITNSR